MSSLNKPKLPCFAAGRADQHPQQSAVVVRTSN